MDFLPVIGSGPSIIVLVEGDPVYCRVKGHWVLQSMDITSDTIFSRFQRRGHLQLWRSILPIVADLKALRKSLLDVREEKAACGKKGRYPRTTG